MDQLFTMNMTKKEIQNKYKKLVLKVLVSVSKKIDSVSFLYRLKKKTVFLMREAIDVTKTAIFLGHDGKLSWHSLSRLAALNLLNKRSRTAVTIAAIASGSGAIVFLVGFAYGLQTIVTNRLVQPNSLRLADVQSSSTAVVLNSEALEQIASIEGIEDVEPAVSLAGTLQFSGSQSEVVVMGLRNKFLDFSHAEIILGRNFSDQAEARALPSEENVLGELTKKLNEGEVAGISTESASLGDEVTGKRIAFRITDDVYVPVRSSYSLSSKIIGFARGNILETRNGTEIWGATYNSSSGKGKSYQSQNGDWFGKWIFSDELPLYQEIAPATYAPMMGESGQQIVGGGYLTHESVQVLSIQDKLADELLEKMYAQQVLGETTDASQSSDTTSTASSSGMYSLVFNQADTATQAALLTAIKAESSDQQASVSQTSAIVKINRDSGNEIIISTGLLNTFGLKAEDLLEKTVEMKFIISAGLVPGLQGRISTETREYVVVGVVRDDDSSLVYAPLSDFESLGVGKHSIAKVLAKEGVELSAVREKVQALGFISRSIADTLAQVDKLFKVMRFLLGSFGMIAFVVALFGMFNTLTVSLLERTREIGVMKTIGTTDTDVVRLLLVESTLIGIMGGIGGIVLGVAMGTVIDVISLIFRDDKTVHLFQYPISLMLMVFCLAIIVGVATGFYPASRARKIKALDALRYE